MPFMLRLASYSGCSPEPEEFETREEARAAAARKIRRHRNVLDYPVTIIAAGKEWELETGENAAMIGDSEGCLWIVEVEPPKRKCFICGYMVDEDDPCCSRDEPESPDEN